MNKEKQIEAMAKCCTYYHAGECCVNPTDICDCDLMCEVFGVFANLEMAGYRKASDVARETVKAIKDEVSKKEQYISDLYGYGGFMIATTDLEDIIRAYIFDTYEEAELKKKYTEERE